MQLVVQIIFCLYFQRKRRGSEVLSDLPEAAPTAGAGVGFKPWPAGCTARASWVQRGPPTDPSLPTGPTAPWNPAPLPATIYCRRCTRSRCQAGLCPSLAWTMTWEGTQLKDSGRRQGRALSRVSSPECVCWCGVRAGVCFWSGFEFFMSPCRTCPGPAGAELMAPRRQGCRLLCH